MKLNILVLIIIALIILFLIFKILSKNHITRNIEKKVIEQKINMMPVKINYQDLLDIKRQTRYNKITPKNFDEESIKLNIKNFKDKPLINITNDSQNVHSHTVLKSSKKSIEKIEKSLDIKDINIDPDFNIKLKLIEFVEDTTKYNEKKKSMVKNMINNKNIFNNDKVYGVDKTILSAATTIYHKIKNNKDHIEILTDNLFDCIDTSGNPVCKTGIIERIISTLDGIDNNVKILPEWAIHMEILNRASVLSKKYQNEEDDNRRANIQNDLINEYKDIIGLDEIEKELKKWIDYI